MSREDAPRIAPGRVALGLLAAMVVGVLVVVSIGRLAGFAELAETLRGASWGWLTLCALGQIVVFAAYAEVFRTAVAADGGPPLGRRGSLRIVLASFALTQVIAAGGAAGLAFIYWSLRRLGFTRHGAGVRVIGLNTLVFLVFGLIGWVAALVALLTGSAPLGMTVPWLVAIPLILGAAAYFTDPVRSARWIGAGDGAARRALGIGIEAATWVRRIGGRPDGRHAMRWAVLYWAGDALSLWAGLRAFGAHAAPAALVLAYVSGYLVQSIPVPFIATGGVDAATTLTLVAIGIPASVALLGVVAHRVFAFWLPLAPGVWSGVTLVRAARAQSVDELAGRT
jgi:uncharacterized membrane protein YbhN (UPF0104 family)